LQSAKKLVNCARKCLHLAAYLLTANELKVVHVLGPVAVEGVISGIDTADLKLQPADPGGNDNGGEDSTEKEKQCR